MLLNSGEIFDGDAYSMDGYFIDARSSAEDEIICYYGGVSARDGGRMTFLPSNSDTSSAEMYKFSSAASYALKHT